MQRITHFSYHGGQRAKQRTAISTQEVALLLDRKLYLTIGKTPGINKEYLLFYSPPDGLCYLAIRNPLTGAVITVLPVSYQGCTGWVVTEEMCKQITEMTLNSPMPELRGLLLRDHTKHDEIKQLIEETEAKKESEKVAAQKKEKARKKKLKAEKHQAEQKLLRQPKFEIKLSYIRSDNRHTIKVIGKILASKYNCEFEQLLRDPDFFSIIDDMVAAKNVDAISYQCLYINLKQKKEITSHVIDLF